VPGRFPLFTDENHLSVVLDAFDELAAKENAFAYPIAYLKLPK
jgi:hypothetical protein